MSILLLSFAAPCAQQSALTFFTPLAAKRINYMA